MKKIWLSVILFSFSLILPCRAENIPDYKNINLPIEKRVDDLVARMTIEEKIAQLRLMSKEITSPDMIMNEGIGFISAQSAKTAQESAEKINRVQKYVVEKSRFGIPAVFFGEALHGVCASGATSFPQAIGLAATFDKDLMESVSQAIAVETKCMGYRQVLAPVVNIARDVRWGRTEETYGEDPYLSSIMGAVFCKNFTNKGIITTPKHFVANFGDGGRDSNPVHFSEMLLREIYFPPFKSCILEGGALSVMPAFNSVNGRPCNANRWLLTDILRKEWGFLGFTMSDAGALEEIMSLHHVAKDKKDAAKQAIEAGLDVELHNIDVYGEPLYNDVKEGLVSEEVINDAARRVLRAKMMCGVFDNPYIDLNKAGSDFNQEEHRKIALDAGRKSIVLLKNEKNILPFPKNFKKLLVLGPIADSARLGGYSGPGINPVSILRGIKNKLLNTNVIYEKGIERDIYAYPPIKSQYFFIDNNGIEKGLKAEYFNNMNLEGEPSLIRIDKQINFHWDSSPDSLIQPDKFSVRWTGKLLAPITGKYRISLSTGDGARFYFDGKLINESWNDRRETTEIFTLDLEKGKKYDIKIEFYENKWAANIVLGWDYGFDENKNILKAVKAAKNANAVVIVATIIEGEFFDRACLDLPGNQEELIKSIARTGKPTVVILENGSAVTMGNWINDVMGIIEVWYPGEEGGDAVADVLFGDYNPAGRLPVTFPKSGVQLPLYYNYKPSGRGYDYVDMDAVPLFPFGFGLSYTQFEYNNLKIKPECITPDEKVIVNFDVKNAGKLKGDEIPQLYIHDIVASVSRPIKELKGFSRISIEPGETKTVSFELAPGSFSLLNEKLQWITEPGTFEIMIGSSSKDIRLKSSVNVVSK